MQKLPEKVLRASEDRPAWVPFDYARLQRGVGDLCIDLGGDDASVTEQSLHVPDIHALFEEVGGDRMAEHVRCDTTFHCGVFADLPNEPSDVLRRCSPTATG